MCQRFFFLIVSLLLLVNSTSPWKLNKYDYLQKRPPGKDIRQGKPPCRNKCPTGYQFSCMANCTKCVPCSHCNVCSCSCVKNRDPCFPMRNHNCGNMLEVKCSSYKNGCFCYCGIASLKMLTGGFTPLK
uniref:Metastriate ixostatin family member n=1 Tax=Rhipicephalus zambeziensis TaxID=60191 RepID=A0A224YF69_9ACAR